MFLTNDQKDQDGVNRYQLRTSRGIDITECAGIILWFAGYWNGERSQLKSLKSHKNHILGTIV